MHQHKVYRIKYELAKDSAYGSITHKIVHVSMTHNTMHMEYDTYKIYQIKLLCISHSPYLSHCPCLYASSPRLRNLLPSLASST